MIYVSYHKEAEIHLTLKYQCFIQQGNIRTVLMLKFDQPIRQFNKRTYIPTYCVGPFLNEAIIAINVILLGCHLGRKVLLVSVVFGDLCLP